MSSKWSKLSATTGKRPSSAAWGLPSPLPGARPHRPPLPRQYGFLLPAEICSECFIEGNHSQQPNREAWDHHLRHCHVRGGTGTAHKARCLPHQLLQGNQYRLGSDLLEQQRWSRADARSRDAPAGAAIRRIEIRVRQFTVSPSIPPPILDVAACPLLP